MGENNNRRNGQNGRETDDVSRRALRSEVAGRVYGNHGGYRNLKAYQLLEMLYRSGCTRPAPKGADMKRAEQTQRTKPTRAGAGKPPPFSLRLGLLCPFCLFLLLLFPRHAMAILAGGESDLPTDFPSNRLDPQTADSPFNAVGALRIDTGAFTYSGTAVVLSRHWVLTAAHNTDFDDNGLPDPGLSYTLHLPGHGTMVTSTAHTHPDFTGFGNPSIHNDLALLYFADPLPELNFPALGLSMAIGDELTLVGFGRSGFGSYGYTTSASTTDRRIGLNTVETLHSSSGSDGLLFRYTFHAPSDPLSLGNDRETIIGPGDSGGPALISWGGGHALVGINTFTEGYGGRFGDIGGGVVLDPAWEWIAQTTGLVMIPEPGTLIMVLIGFVLLVRLVSRN